MVRVLLTFWVLAAASIHAQDYGARLGEVRRGGRVSFEPTGPGVMMDALDPVVRKWYVPQELYAEYQWTQGGYSNYAREAYQRYVDTAIQGNYYYDVYGNFLTRGWLIVDWRQQNPLPFGSLLYKDNRFSSWFNNVVVAADHKGQYHYALTVGDQIRTTLTPLTFSKPLFNGIQVDFASDKYKATLLLSRISEPNFVSSGTAEISGRRTFNTNLIGSRLEIQVGDFIEVGGTLVNAHHAQTQAEAFGGGVFKGNLTGVQNQYPVSSIEILIKDDSPEDGHGGGSLFASDLLIWDLDGKQTRGSEIGFRPVIEGGFQRRGYLAADGREVIQLRYDFFARGYTGPDPTRIKRVQLELVVANDYLVEVASDRQTGFQGNVIFLPVARAAGNVKDSSNQRVLAFDYGLQTAVQVAGFSVELKDLQGVDGYLEVDLNHQYRQYPNPGVEKHGLSSSEALAWLLNLSKVAYPYFAFGEAFSIAPEYTTSMPVVDERGIVDYANRLQRYEFVDDNDDQDRFPDWGRKGWSSGDKEVFPGWDENNDFISDFNQNDNESSPNLIPDYEEPFLRFYVDRPEVLYGVDMNHNGVIDHFENDLGADYPYPKDREGYNVYGGAFFSEDVRLSIGRQNLRQITDHRQGEATYLLLTADWKSSQSRLRLFQDLRRVRDSIRDDLEQWIQVTGSRGELLPVVDPLPAPNTWINTTWMGADYTPLPGLRLSHLLKWHLYHQLDGPQELEIRGMRGQSSFFGLIEKIEYRLNIQKATLSSAWKNQFLQQTPVHSQDPRLVELNELLLLTAHLPIFRSSALEGGVEYHLFKQLRHPTPPGAEDSFSEWTTIAQLNNLSAYQGYRLTTIVGFDITRQYLKVEGVRTRTRGFLTVYAGVEQ